MRTMKRAAAVALSVVMLMTSGVSAKAAVTGVQPAKSKDEAVEKWANQIGKPGDYNYDTGVYTANNLSEITLVGDYIYAADDNEHCIKKIDKKTGEIVKKTQYKDETYTIHDGCSIGAGDDKVYVGYANGVIQAFRQDTLESVWVTDSIPSDSYGDNAIGSEFVYDDGYLYIGTGTYPSSSAKGAYAALTTKDENEKEAYETKELAWTVNADSTYYWSKSIAVGNWIVACDNGGDVKVFEKKTGKIVGEVKLNAAVSGGVTYDAAKKMIYVCESNPAILRGIKLDDNGQLELQSQSVEVYEGGAVAATPEVYNGKVYVGGTTDPSDRYNKPGFMAVVDVSSDQYKVNYTVQTPSYSQSEPVVVKSSNDSVNVYFTVNTMPGGIYMIEDSKGATSAKLQTIYEPTKKDQQQYCMNDLKLDSDGTLYYINDSRYLFAVGKKATDTKPTTPSTSTSEATTTVVNETKVKPVTKTVKSERSVKLTWKKKKGAKGYVIYAKAGKGKYKKVTTVGKKTSKTIKVNKDTSYKFKVKPYKLTKNNKKKYYKTYAAKAKFGSKTVKVTFKNVTGFASYKVQMKAGKAAYKTVKTTAKGGTITYTKKKAKVGTTYKFRLKGINKANGKTVSVVIK